MGPGVAGHAPRCDRGQEPRRPRRGGGRAQVRGSSTALEGGFSLGGDATRSRTSVEALAEAGVAYITLAHLFWRHIATNAPALPFMPDWLYQAASSPGHGGGLSKLGRRAIKEMIAHRILSTSAT